MVEEPVAESLRAYLFLNKCTVFLFGYQEKSGSGINYWESDISYPKEFLLGRQK